MGVREVLIGRDYHRQAGGVKEELNQMVVSLNGIMSDYWEESRPRDQKRTPHGYHPCSGVS